MSGRPERALIPAVEAFSVFHEPVVTRQGRLRRVSTSLWRLALLVAGLVSLVLGLVGIGGLATVVVGALGTIAYVFIERESVSALIAENRSRAREHADTVIDFSDALRESSADAKVRVDRFLGEPGKRDVPAVVIVDDASWADDDTVDFVDALLARAAPVLVVATVRPGPPEIQLRDGAGFGRLARDFNAKTRRFRLEGLSDEALTEIVLTRAPRTDSAVARMLAEAAHGNPLILGALLEEPVVARTLSNGSYELNDPATVLSTLPKDYEGVFERYWERLPEDVRQVLSIASLHGLLVQPDSVQAGYHAAFGEGGDALIAKARDPHFWLAKIDEFLDRFPDPALLDVTSRGVHRVVTAEELDRARAQMILDLTTRRANIEEWERLSADARSVLLRAAV
jgi:hypothetical protein